MKTQKVLICSDSFKRISGLSYVALNIAKYFFFKGYDVHYCVISGEDSKVDDLINKGHFFHECFLESQIFNCQNKKESSYRDFNELLKKLKPNIVFSIHDLWQFEHIAFSEYRDTFTWIAYCPIESDFYSEYLVNPSYYNKNIRKSLSEICKGIDYAIPYNIVGKAQLSKLKANTTDPLPNGLNDYYFDDSEIDRYKIFKGMLKDDDFLFMTVGHNFNRKGLDYVVDAFYQFLQHIEDDKKKKYKLYIHGYLDTVDVGTDIKSMIHTLKLSNNILMSQPQQISKRDLYKRYKCANCYIGLPLAEGFGYGFMEAMINGIPIIYHKVGGISEYIKNSLSISSVATMRPNNYYCDWKIPDVEEASSKMLVAVDFIDREVIKKCNYEEGKKYTWDAIYHRLDSLLDCDSMGRDDIFHNLSIKKVV